MKSWALGTLLSGITVASIAACGGPSDEEVFKHCPDDTRKLITEQIGPIDKFHFDKADYDPEKDPLIEDDSTIREGYAIVKGKRYWFQCSTANLGRTRNDIEVRLGDSTVITESIEH